MDEIPFEDVVIHGTILDEQGRKMSKSLGNGIDPIVIIEQYGADACRFSLMVLATEGQDLKLSESKFEMGRNFANKVWNAARFVLMNLSAHDDSGVEPGEPRFEDRWILSRLQACTEALTDQLERYRTHEAARDIYDFFWHSYCDWYVEIVKARMDDEADPADRRRAKETLATVLDQALRLLHPITPFLTEELWQNLKVVATEAGLDTAGTMQSDALIRARWPEGDPARRDRGLEEEMDMLQDVIRAIRSVRKEKGIADRKPIDVVISCPDEQTADIITRHEGFLELMAVLGDLEHGVSVDKPKRCATTVVGTVEIFLRLEGLIDLEQELERLRKQREDLTGRITGVEKTLQNQGFLNNAPEEVVQQRRETLQDLQAQLRTIEQNLSNLE
jgi:valyl-tRNA synthetase